MTELPNFKDQERTKKEYLAKAVQTWNNIGIQQPEDLTYTLEDASNQPYLMINSYKNESGKYVWPRLYQDDLHPQDFKLFANGGDVALLLDIMEKLMEKGVRVTSIIPGHGHFESISEEDVKKRVQELKSQYLK